MLLALACLVALGAEDPFQSALETELDRTMAAWEGEPDGPYFLGYRVGLTDDVYISSRNGSDPTVRRHSRGTLDVTARVGDYTTDSTHPIRDQFWFNSYSYRGVQLPVDADELAVRVPTWDKTREVVLEARQNWHRVKGNLKVKVDEEDAAPDFARAEPAVELLDVVESPATDDWQPLLVELSGILNDDPDILESTASLVVRNHTKHIVNSEGTRVREPRLDIRLTLAVEARAEDGMDLRLSDWHDVSDLGDLPEPEVLRARAADLRAQVVKLREAPVGQAYSGPMILRGKAAAVFVHEVLGHRLEGHRQDREDQGQTFTDKVGTQLLPAELSLVDDPTLDLYDGKPLAGFYRYDEEGVPAQRVTLIEDGVLRGFLMGRDPTPGFEHSNGHGRADAGRQPVARMGNTILETNDPVPYEDLREMLRQQIAASGRDYGLVVDEIAGGFTYVGRYRPNAFNVRALTAWKVYADGRPDELVRGVDLIGTPLVTLGQILAAGDDPDVFNGHCGAESGSVPVSGVSPSLLFGELEMQLKEKESNRPPLLPKPLPDKDS